MKALFPLIALLLFCHQATLAQMAGPQSDATKSVQASKSSVTPLGNEDVLTLMKENVSPEVVVAKINSSACTFDTSPATLQRLKAEGVPDAVILAMTLAEKSAPIAGDQLSAAVPEPPKKRLSVKIPPGTLVEIEAAYTINSQQIKQGDLISFRVVNPVMVDGVTVIETGATATGRIIKASRGGHFGRAGRLAWEMRDVTAADGTRLPLQSPGRIVGDSKGAKVATQTVLTGLLLGPAAPLALLNGFKRGENAYLLGGKRFEVFIQGETTVSAAEPR